MPSEHTEPGVMTSFGRHSALLDGLPSGPAELAAVVHGLMVHGFLTHLYGATPSEQEREAVHLRPADELLDAILAKDDRPLTVPRPVPNRVIGNCRQITVLAVAMLRATGTPARSRCGFGDYFGSGFFEDHWVCEVWTGDRWVLHDAQLDERQREAFGVDFDPADVPRDRFLVAGDAWGRCRAGTADPANFGLSSVGESGDWWIAGNLMRDAAALCDLELLPWDCWGAMPLADVPVEAETVVLCDRLAELTVEPNVPELRGLLREDDRLRVPPTVYNELRDRREPLPSFVLR